MYGDLAVQWPCRLIPGVAIVAKFKLCIGEIRLRYGSTTQPGNACLRRDVSG